MSLKKPPFEIEHVEFEFTYQQRKRFGVMHITYKEHPEAYRLGPWFAAFRASSGSRVYSNAVSRDQVIKNIITMVQTAQEAS